MVLLLEHRKSNTLNMILNIFKVTLRNLVRHKFYSLINLVGLTLGIATFIYMAIYVNAQLKYDRYHTQAEQIYRVYQTNIWTEADVFLPNIGPAVGPLIKDEFPQVKAMARVYQPGNFFISYEEQGSKDAFEHNKLAGVDAAFFSMFDFEWIAGNPEKALQEQNEVVLTKSIAMQYFGEASANVLGKILKINNGNFQQNVKVGGIIDDYPAHTHLQFDMFFSISTFPIIKRMEWSWIFSQCITYVLLHEDTDITTLEKGLENLPPKFAGESIERVMGYSYEEFEKQGKPWKLFIQPLKDIHLYSANIVNPYAHVASGSIQNVFIFAFAAFFILLLACINFVNLATARASGRAKEIGVRKTLGSSKKALMMQFMSEAVLLSFLALIIALGICELLRPQFNQLAGPVFMQAIHQYHEILLALPLIALLIGVLAGGYPALYLTRFKPVAVLKGNLNAEKGTERNFRKVLVGLQFAVSAFMVICTLLVLSQIDFLRNRNLGYDRDNLLTIRNLELLDENENIRNDKIENLKQSVLQFSGVEYASSSNFVMPHIYSQDYFTSDLRGEKFIMNFIKTDEDFLKMTGIPLLKGKEFSKESGNATHIIINEAAARELGFSKQEYDKAIGVNISFPNPQATKYKVIGIMEDTQLEGLDNVIEPLGIFPIDSDVYNPSSSFYLTLRINPEADLPQLINGLQATWKTNSDGLPFQYNFVDDAFDTIFKSEKRMASILGVFSFLAIVLAVLGMVGLIAFIASKKTKEIGIRKILGAEPWQLLVMLSKEFSWLVVAGFFIAMPLSYWFINDWLQGFTYKIEIPPLVFVAVLMGGLLLAWLIITLQTMNTLKMKAVDALKDD